MKLLVAQGKFNQAKIFTDNVEKTAFAQIIELCNQEFVEDSQIRIMPDTHAGAGCTIGTTMTIQDKIVPNLVGVDIGCGMEVGIINVNKSDVKFEQLDDVIRNHVPSGFSVRGNIHEFANAIPFEDLRTPVNIDRAQKSIGTLGGGNHFIELNEFGDKIAIVIHSGSRNLGKQVAEHYQKRAYDELVNIKDEKAELIAKLTKEGRQSEIHEALRGIKKPFIHKDLAYLQGQGFDDYIHDMRIAQQYAELNRKAMVLEIITRMGWLLEDHFTTIHNYIDMDNMILRKGAISAQKDERVIIPINMRDGSIIATGKGNEDWNFSGPHGAGRVLSRSKAKELLSIDEFKETMDGVWSTSVSSSTLDESPMAYKSIHEIVDNIGDTVEINHIIKPLYNFKAN